MENKHEEGGLVSLSSAATVTTEQDKMQLGALGQHIGPDSGYPSLEANELFPGSQSIHNPLAPLNCLKTAGSSKENNHSLESAENPAWHSESRNPLSQSAGGAGTVGEKEELKSEIWVVLQPHQGQPCPHCHQFPGVGVTSRSYTRVESCDCKPTSLSIHGQTPSDLKSGLAGKAKEIQKIAPNRDWFTILNEEMVKFFTSKV